MVICVVAMFVFAIMGIFSARYRALAKEAFLCTFRMITFRPCSSSLDQRIKSSITSKLMKPLPHIARFVYKYFKLLSLAFVMIFFVSMFYTVRGVYNLAVHGTCDPHSTTCIFNPGHLHCGSEHCLATGCPCEEKGCEAPDHLGCDGNCTCKVGTCG